MIPGPLTLTHPDRRLSPELLQQRGGFAWWYADGLDAQGNGLVVIWSFGLPFLPGYLDAARAQRAPTAAERPSLSLALYEGGEQLFYLLQEYPADRAQWDGDTVRLGESVFVSRPEGGRRVVSIQLDCPVPATGQRLTGEILLRGPRRVDVGSPAAVPLSTHDWSPLVGPSRMRAAIAIDGAPFFGLDGRGYHDRNGSSRHFDDLDISHWVWGRAPFEDREAIFYLVYPRSRERPPILLGITVDGGGRTQRLEDIEVRGRGRRLARYGMPFERELRIEAGGKPWLDVQMDRCVDDGPFYLRFLTKVRDADGNEVLGAAEYVRPGRVDRPALRPFVRMKVHRVGGPNSSFLPLFTGPRPGRLTRQLGELVPALARLGS